MPPESRIPPARHLDADSCIDLVNGLLTPAARLDLLAHAAGCADCEALLREVAATHERGRARAADVLAAAAVAAPGGLPRRAPARFRGNAWLAAAAVAIVMAGAWFVAGRSTLMRRGVEPGFVPLPIVEPSRLAVVRDGSGTDSLVLLGVEAYQRQDFETARRLLATPHADRGMEVMRRVYLASAQVRCDKADSALVTLGSVRPSQLPEPWRSESEWTRMVAFARAGMRTSADSLLDMLTQGVGPVQDRARRLRAGNR
jgi:hypothetical protein